MANVDLSRGQSSTLPSEIQDGALRFTTDTGRIYLDTDSERVELYGDAISLSYSTRLEVASWQGSGTNWTYSYSNNKLRATHPPIIACVDHDKTYYNNITEALATTGVGIEFHANSKPSQPINLVVVDLG